MTTQTEPTENSTQLNLPCPLLGLLEKDVTAMTDEELTERVKELHAITKDDSKMDNLLSGGKGKKRKASAAKRNKKSATEVAALLGL